MTNTWVLLGNLVAPAFVRTGARKHQASANAARNQTSELCRGAVIGWGVFSIHSHHARVWEARGSRFRFVKPARRAAKSDDRAWLARGNAARAVA